MIATVGAGTIGTGVAQALAACDYRVLLLDHSEIQLGRALRNIRRGIRAQRLVGGAHPVPDPDEVLRRIDPTTDPDQLVRTHIVIENVTENWTIKEALYRDMAKITDPQTVFCANTSTIPITQIASATEYPDRVIGMHFMNPVPIMPAVELIRGHHTSERTIRTARRLVAGLGKHAILVEDSPGFVTNRVMMLVINEAIFILQDRVAETPQDVDRLLKTCLGRKMGPLETADLIGLDTVLFSMEELYRRFSDSKYRPCPLLRKMVSAGILGRKSGHGFYRYHQVAA
ncbi:MAG: 3-hydroxyacyl-CoA dehydrogenase NAD-binding domain-containing protein [Candidatus Binatia bacterium]|nr:3-hydroxyacyl-CoA dehydrogenase NAD-binding domain-containing protein [Candidatus Binatia bacterium]